MSQQKLDVNTAALSIVMLVMASLQRITERRQHLPGMAVLYGFSGFGKSTAAAFVANKMRAYYIECKSVWTKKALLENILKVMGITPAHTVTSMLDQVCEQLARSGRPLIIDEMDHIVEKAAVEIVRDIYEGSKAPILLIGEERLPAKLVKWERFHGRIMEWTAAPAADVNDVKVLANFYCPGITIGDDLLSLIHTKAKGSVRRIATNLELIKDEAANQGTTTIGLKQWGKRDLYTGEAPQPRRLS
ncbi:ATP-binding protein [Trichlorobacter lovleyi]|uniref:AAA family ATPase n=1 Tax=Trichlorobacter lovleyi TaxID=313985 RepID=UPI00223FB8D8|nr:ATP-binding protein [Trichlorobacter lovleyi]QOX79830.1 ATP-binding protein [Trichlorobacter lovleyi]